MLIKKRPDLAEHQVTDETLYHARRDFLARCGHLTCLSLFGGLLGCGDEASSATQTPQWLSDQLAQAQPPQPAFTTDETRTPFEDVTRYNNFYEFDSDKGDPARHSDRFKPHPWSVVVEGACQKPGRYALEDLVKPHRLEERIYRLRCVEAWSMVVPWVGLPLASLLRRFEPDSRARFVRFETLFDPQQMPGQAATFAAIDYPYVEGLRIDEAMHPLAFIAVGLYGKPLPAQNGAPLRLVVPWKYGFKSIKSIVRIEFVETQPLTTWERSAPSEYGFYANVNPAVDHPRWSQKSERRLPGSLFSPRVIPTRPFNGYEEVASLYSGMDLRRLF